MSPAKFTLFTVRVDTLMPDTVLIVARFDSATFHDQLDVFGESERSGLVLSCATNVAFGNAIEFGESSLRLYHGLRTRMTVCPSMRGSSPAVSDG